MANIAFNFLRNCPSVFPSSCNIIYSQQLPIRNYKDFASSNRIMTMRVSSFQFSCSVVSNSLRPHELQHARPPCTSPTPGAFSDSCPLNRWLPSNHLILCHPLLLLPSIFPSIRVFSNESALHIMWPKYWSFSFNISPSDEYSGLISFEMDWLDLFAVQGTLKSLPNTTVQKHQFFSTQLSL